MAGLAVHETLYRFVESELLPAIAIDSAAFWQGAAELFRELGAQNRALLETRDKLQQQLDDWHARHGLAWNHDEYLEFLRSIGYLEKPVAPFRINTTGVDPEIAEIAGPQLVVPVSNARFALNACNARWGSLYDALYGTDVIPESRGRERRRDYNRVRGDAVIAYAMAFLDRAVPLAGGSYADVVSFAVKDASPARFVAVLEDGRETGLCDPGQFGGWAADGDRRRYLLRNHGLHIELHTDPDHPVGRKARAHLADVILESAISTIQDMEDSVAAVDADDKTWVYRHWLGLMQGTLVAEFSKGGRQVTRRLQADRVYTTPAGEALTLPGRSLMLVRNVGHLTTTDAVLDANGEEVYEGILDALVSAACALAGDGRNSRSGSIYIVKPKLHGPAEARFTDRLFGRVESLLGLAGNTIKIGLMDEERRTTVNLEACIHAVRSRLVFINTGFLDRTGDEIHTTMQAGAVMRKEVIKAQPWIRAYEDWNVDIGIRCGLPGKAQIGKGMWPKPDRMQEMMQAKQSHPEAGASCAWVPSPTAATLHAMHYHYVDVRARQEELASRPLASLDAILTPPLADPSGLGDEEIQAELDNNAQGILGYVVRWIDQGIGCSKVPDIDGTGLMEDRATLRISSQHMANWLLHGVTNEAQVIATFRRMARVVDAQNAADPGYRRMCDDLESSTAFRTAVDLVLQGCEQPNGYTEPLLHARRRQVKAGRARTAAVGVRMPSG